MVSAILGFGFDYLIQRFGRNVPADALKMVQPILVDLIANNQRLTDETSLELQARLDEALRTIGYKGV